MTLASKPAESSPSLISGVLARLAQIALVFALQGVILFVGAGRLDWIWAWVYLAICVATVAINSTFLRRTNLEVVAERGRAVGHMRNWDRLVSGVWSLSQYLVLPLIAALDVRFGWTGDVSLAAHLAGAIVLACGLGIFSSAMIVNAYFSTAACVQTERGQTVCRSGPYRFVRHPGYAGAILQSIGIPFLLGSAWATLPAVVAIVAIVARTVLEDRMLYTELTGYSEYASDVRFRLVPGVW